MGGGGGGGGGRGALAVFVVVAQHWFHAILGKVRAEPCARTPET